MMMKNKRPEIRFKEFSDDWEQQKFSETFTKISNNTLSRAELNYNSGLAKNIHYGDVLIKFGELLDVEKDELPYITDDFLSNKFKSSKLQIGDVIMADAAEDEMVGKCAELVNVGEEIIFSGLHTIPIRPMQLFAFGYLGYFMNSPVYHNQLLRLMQGTKVLSISKTTLQDTSIYYPINSEEQSQIGTFFKNLDHLLTLHQQKYNKLVTIKKAMLEKMFPQNGAKVPEIRFKGFTEAWEERKLGEISESFAYGLNAAATFYDGVNKYIRITDIDDKSHNFINDDLTSPNTDLSFAEKYKLKIGDVLFARTGASVGKSYIYKEIDGLVYFAGFLIRARIKPEFNSVFVFQNTLTSKYDKFIRITSQRSGQPGVNAQEYGFFSFMIPNREEQDKIAKYFQDLDYLINIHHHELEKLKNIKKACLEKMFV